MTDSPPDDARPGSAEANMRRALGLHGDAARQSATDHSTGIMQGSHPQRRRFVRDGEVPVTVIHRDHRQEDSSSINQLDAARQAIRSQATAREHAERALAEAQATIRAVQTALAHERLAKDEMIRRAEVEKQGLQTVQAELVVERALRDRLERSLRDSETTIQNLHARLHEVRTELTMESLARKKAEDTVRDAARGVTKSVGRDEVVDAPVRRPVGRPRKIAVVPLMENTVEPSAKAQAGRIADKKGLAKAPRAARLPAGKPIKWWLTETESSKA